MICLVWVTANHQMLVHVFMRPISQLLQFLMMIFFDGFCFKCLKRLPVLQVDKTRVEVANLRNSLFTKHVLICVKSLQFAFWIRYIKHFRLLEDAEESFLCLFFIIDVDFHFSFLCLLNRRRCRRVTVLTMPAFFIKNMAKISNVIQSFSASTKGVCRSFR